jgi:hypothetical protein
MSSSCFKILPFSLLIALVGSGNAPAADEQKSVVVDKSTFSAIYPAVWFDPVTAKIAPLTTQEETPPAENFQIWIEPKDPEIAFLAKNEATKDCGFVFLGIEETQFKNPVLPANPKWEQRVPKDWFTSEGGAVIYCRARGIDCVLRLTASDKAAQVLKFDWRPLPKK